MRGSAVASLMIVGILAAGGCSGPAATGAPGTFTRAGSMKTSRNWGTATLLQDGRVLFAGGASDVEQPPVASAELFDSRLPSFASFNWTGSMRFARWGHTATLLPDGRVLIAAGENGSKSLASAELYDPKTSTLSRPGR